MSITIHTYYCSVLILAKMKQVNRAANLLNFMKQNNIVALSTCYDHLILACMQTSGLLRRSRLRKKALEKLQKAQRAAQRTGGSLKGQGTEEKPKAMVSMRYLDLAMKLVR